MSPTGQYTQRFTRKYPGLFIILLDQSLSMNETIAGQKNSKAEVATTALNTIIHEMINFARFEETGDYVRKKYAYLSILGYNNTVYPLLYNTDAPTSIPYLAEHPAGFVRSVRKYEVSPGNFRTIQEKKPFWIEPKAYGNTQMALAFMRAKEIALDWLNSAAEPNQAERKKCFPPVIINITDAKHNGEGDHVGVSLQIQTHGTEQGNILIFNCHFTEQMTQPCIFPGDIKEVENLDSYGLATNMFQMSSIMPQILKDDATNLMPRGQQLHKTARCLVYNANPDILIKFLRWGTAQDIQTGR